MDTRFEINDIINEWEDPRALKSPEADDADAAIDRNNRYCRKLAVEVIDVDEKTWSVNTDPAKKICARKNHVGDSQACSADEGAPHQR